MKLPALLLGFLLVCSLGIAGYIHSRRKQELHLNKQASFLDIKFRVTRDVLGEYKEQFVMSNTQMEKTKKEVDVLTKEVSKSKSLAAQKKSDSDLCKGNKKQYTDEVAAAESERKHIKSEYLKKRSRWDEELAFFRKQLQQESTLCKYIDKASKEGRKLCNIAEEPEPKKPEAKPKEPEADEAKPEENPEQPKSKKNPEDPKPEEKPEDPKPEEKPQGKKGGKVDAKQPKVNVQ